MCCMNLKRAVGLFAIAVYPAICAQANNITVLQQSTIPMEAPASNAAQPQTNTGTSSTMQQNIVDPLISATVPITPSTNQAPAPAESSSAQTPSQPAQVAVAPSSVTQSQNMPSAASTTSPIPPAPAAPIAVTTLSDAPAEENDQESTVGIDTMDVQGETKGNWLYKRFWWERARKLHDEIINRLKVILAERDSFSEQATSIENTVFADFYEKSGYEKGELDSALTLLKTDVEEQRAKGCPLNEQERAAFTALEQEKEQLEQLQKTIQTIHTLSTLFDDALKILNQQVELCSSYEQQAREQLTTIERELSDKQAKESYHQMRTSFENIINIEQYIKGDFAQYFANLTAKTQEHMAAVLSSLAGLKERGIDLTKQIDKIRNKNCQPESVQTNTTESDDDSSTGVLHWLSTAWNNVSNSLHDGYQWVRSFWSSNEQTSETDVEQTATPASANKQATQ